MNEELICWSGPHGLPRFDAFSEADFAPAFDATLKLAEDAVEAIAANPEAPSFANTVAALETSEDPLNNLCAVFYTLTNVNSNDRLQALERDVAPRLAAHSSRISMDRRLYDRVQEVWQERAALPAEDRRLVELSLRHFRRAGAGLEGDARDRMAEIRSRLAVLYTEFSQNVLRDERDYVLPVADDRLGGLPDWLLESMRAAAVERGLGGQVVTLNRSLIVPFLQYSTDRDLRETAWRGWSARGTGQGAGGEATDNRPIIAEILRLRHERAQLLGYEDFAAFKLEPEMARDAGRVEDLLKQVWAPARVRAEADAAELEKMLHRDGVNGDLAPWDWRFYAQRKSQAEHQLDQGEIKPYFTLDAMIAAVFDVASRLYGLGFEPFTAPLWDPNVRAWRILRDGKEMAIFLGDYYARPSKRSGAWNSTVRAQHGIGQGQRAILVNVCNFTPPAQPGEPSYLSWDDARTLFHEFGHALHGILSDVTWPSMSGLAVARDFVELPSQLYEHWLEQPQVLDAHARHAKTGAPLPAALRDRLLKAGKSDAGFSTVEYLESALVDLALHRGAPAQDPMRRSEEVLAELDAPKAIPMRHGTAHFSHVFSGDGYSAGYYSYMWSEVMDADAFAAFEETGDIFDPETARRLEREILSKGDSAPADQLWTNFRERMPGVAPLLKGRGLIDA